MKTGIIVHSHTGHTLTVAEKIKDLLIVGGKDAVLARVSAEDEKARTNMVLSSKPETASFDTILFGAPVWAFNLSPVMKAYLNQLDSLKGKKVVCFVTQGGFGGGRSVRQMVKICRAKGAEVVTTEVIKWGKGLAEESVEEAAKKLVFAVK